MPRVGLCLVVTEIYPGLGYVERGECGSSMLNSPQSQPTAPTGKRKRKIQRVVESDNDSENERQAVKVEEGTIKLEDSTTAEEQSIKSEALQDQIIKEEASPGPTSPNKQAGKRKAITRTPRKSAAKSPDKFNLQEDAHEDGTAVATEAKGKNKDIDEGRPAKRPKLPSMRKNASTTAVSTPIGGNTPTVEKSMPAVVGSSTTVPSRQIVDGPVSNEIDMRDGKAFSSLLKKVGDHTASYSSSHLMNRRPRPSKVRLDTTSPPPRRWSSRKQSSLS
jgi:hypothetical protein